MQPAAVLSIVVAANTGPATRGLLRLNTTLAASESSAHKALGAVKTLAKGSALAAGGGIAYAVSKAADFEQQLDSLGAVSDATGRQMDRLRKQAMKAGADTKFSALEAAQAQTELAKGGLSVSQIMRGGLRASLALAAAGEMELAEAAESTVNAMKLFGLNGRAAMKVADGLATAANSTTADVSDFALALKMGGSAAKAAGLDFTETVAALETLAEMGIKGSDAGTSLKSALTQLAAPSEKALGVMDKLGLSFFDAEGNMKPLTDVSAMLRRRLGDLTREQRLATATTLVGTDGMRALLALYDAGPQKIAKFERELGKQGTAASVAAEKQDNLRGKLENLQGTIETIAISVGSKMLPALTSAADQINAVLNDPNLTTGEKFNRLGQMLGDAFAKAIPIIANHAAQAAPIAAEAFVKGWLAAGIWGRLLIGGWLFAKLGGAGAFMAVGSRAGAAMGAGAGAGLLGGLTSKLKGKGGLVGIAALVAAVFGPEVVKGFTQLGDRSRFAGTEFDFAAERMERLQRAGNMTGLAKAAADAKTTARALGESGRPLNALADRFLHVANVSRRVQNEFGRMRQGSILSIRELRQVTQSNFKAIAETMGVNSKAGREALQTNFRLGLRSIRDFRERGVLTTREAGREISKLLRVHSGAGKESLKRNYKEARDFIAATMRNSKGITREGMSAIRRIFAKELQLYGLSKEAVKFRLEGKEQSGKTIGAPLVGKQRGGPIDTGKASGDSVPAVLERGEYVLNRKAVRKVGRKALDMINFASAPRFQTGGWVGDDPSGLNSAVKSMSLWAMRKYGASASDTLRAPGTLTSSGNVSDHTTGAAVDLVSPNMLAMAKGLVQAFQPRLKQLIHTPLGYSINYGQKVGAFAQEDHYDHVHIAALGKAVAAAMMRAPKLARQILQGPDSPLKSIAQNALDKVRGGALKRLRGLTQVNHTQIDIGGPGAAGFEGGGTPAKNRALGIQMAKARGWGGAEWRALDYLWGIGESAWDHHADNPTSSAYGIPQAMGHLYPETTTPQWRNSPAMQIKWGLDYIKNRYGSPSKALAFWRAQSPHWYQKGGEVGRTSRWGQGINAKELPSFFKSVWGRAKGLSGLKGPMPDFMRGGLEGRENWGEYTPGMVHFNPKMLAALRDPKDRNHGYALTTLLHEMAHAAQKRDLTRLTREGGADMWAHWAAGHIFPGLGINFDGTSTPYGYPKQAAWVAENMGEKWWQQTQFRREGGLVGYAGDSLGVGTLAAGLRGKLGKVDLVGRALGGAPSKWGAGLLGQLMRPGMDAAVLDMGTNDGTAANLASSIGQVEKMLGKRPLLMSTVAGASTDAANKNRLIRNRADKVIPWAAAAGKYLTDGIHPNAAGYGVRAGMIASAVRDVVKGQKVSPGKKQRKPRQPKKYPGGAPPAWAKIGGAVRLLQTGDKDKRSEALRDVLDHIHAVGLPDGIDSKVDGFTEQAEVAAEMVNRASQLTTETADGELIPGIVGGKSEADWLHVQLQALFKLRNQLVQAENIIRERREIIGRLLEKAQRRLEEIADEIRYAAQVRKQVQADLDKAKKHPKKNKRLISNLKHLLGRIDDDQEGRTRARKGLGRIIGALSGKRERLATSRGDMLSSVNDVQGVGSPLQVLSSLPEVGVLGGQIFDVQMRLRELAAPREAISDLTGAAEGDESAALLKELLREANLRTLVSQKQFDVFRGMPPYGGEFATGGVVPGPLGEARTIVAHGGETVVPPGAGGPMVVQVIVEDGAVDSRKIKAIAKGEAEVFTRHQARIAGRGLPGGRGLPRGRH